MINHYQRVVDKATEYKIMVNSHESVRPSGLKAELYPNWIACEKLLVGTEFEAMGGNNPDHTTILPIYKIYGWTNGLHVQEFSKHNRIIMMLTVKALPILL